MNLKLGRHRVTVYTRQSFMRSHIMARHLSDLGEPPALSPDWVKAVDQQTGPNSWRGMGNFDYGDCVFALMP